MRKVSQVVRNIAWYGLAGSKCMILNCFRDFPFNRFPHNPSCDLPLRSFNRWHLLWINLNWWGKMIFGIIFSKKILFHLFMRNRFSWLVINRKFRLFKVALFFHVSFNPIKIWVNSCVYIGKSVRTWHTPWDDSHQFFILWVSQVNQWATCTKVPNLKYQSSTYKQIFWSRGK